MRSALLTPSRQIFATLNSTSAHLTSDHLTSENLLKDLGLFSTLSTRETSILFTIGKFGADLRKPTRGDGRGGGGRLVGEPLGGPAPTFLCGGERTSLLSRGLNLPILSSSKADLAASQLDRPVVTHFFLFY